jgi:hypothetical protein
LKVETLEQFLKRGGKIKKVNNEEEYVKILESIIGKPNGSNEKKKKTNKSAG